MKKMYVIRASGDYEILIIEANIVLGEGDKVEKANYYRYELLYPEKGLQKITKEDVEGYFSGQADGWGYGPLPKDGFETFEELKEWAEKAALEAAKRWHEEYRKDYKEKHGGEEPKTIEQEMEEIREMYKEDFGYYPGEGPELETERDKFGDWYERRVLGLEPEERIDSFGNKTTVYTRSKKPVT